MQDQYNNFAREVDRALKEMEERLYRNTNEKIESVQQHLNQRRLSQQSLQSLAKERQKVIESTSSLLGGGSLGGGQPNMKRLEGALNEWLERVEEQVN